MPYYTSQQRFASTLTGSRKKLARLLGIPDGDGTSACSDLSEEERSKQHANTALAEEHASNALAEEERLLQDVAAQVH